MVNGVDSIDQVLCFDEVGGTTDVAVSAIPDGVDIQITSPEGDMWLLRLAREDALKLQGAILNAANQRVGGGVA